MPPVQRLKPVPVPITDVPQSKVGDIVQTLLDDDLVTELLAMRQPDGKFTLRPQKVMHQSFFRRRKETLNRQINQGHGIEVPPFADNRKQMV